MTAMSTQCEALREPGQESMPFSSVPKGCAPFETQPLQRIMQNVGG